MASEIRVNSLTNRSGLSTVSITDAGLNAVGIITAHNFKTGTTDVHSTGVTAADGVFTGNVSVTGNLNVSGVLTYDDVTNIDSVGIITARAGVKVPDNQKIFLGTGDDLQIYHDGSNSIIKDNGTGKLILDTDGTAIEFQKQGLETIASFNSDGAVELYHNNVKKLETTTTGANVTGDFIFGANSKAKLFENGTQSGVQATNSGSSSHLMTHDGNEDIHVDPSGYIKFEVGGSERLRIGSGGGHKITCAEGYYAANLTECNDGRIALNINQTRQGQTKAIAIGAISGNSATGIQCYDTSNNSANNLILNPFGGNMGLGTNNPTSDGGTTFEIYNDNTPSIRLNDGGAYKALFQLRGNDLEIRGSNGQLEFYTGNADGASSSLRGAITSAGHKWTHNGSIFHGSNDVTDFTQSSRDTYNNVSLRSGHQSAGTSPANTNSAIKIYPAGVRSTQTGNLTGGIAWQHLDPNNGTWGSDFGSGSQIWMGAALHDTPGQERDRFNLWMNDQTSAGSNPNNLAIEAYPDGIVRHPKVPAFNAKGFSAHRDLSTWHNVDLNNWISVDQNGSHYNNSNGRFTAPVPGKYFFIYTSMFHNPQTADFHNNITKNGTVVVYSNNHSGGGNANGHQWNDCTVQIVITLAAGDYVTARSTGGNNNTTYLYGSGASNYSTFCGFLIG